MRDSILEIAGNLKTIIALELPNDKSKMTSFIANLDERFPECSRTIRAIFEIEYEKKFNEKFIW